MFRAYDPIMSEGVKSRPTGYSRWQTLDEVTMMIADAQPEPHEAAATRPRTGLPRDAAPLIQELTKAERIARVRAVRGKYAHVPTSSERFIQSKQEEIAREDRRS